MTPDVLYMVIVAHPKGSYVSETDVDRMGFERVLIDIRDRQYPNVEAVYEINLVNHTCRDATHDRAFQEVIPE